MEELSMKLPGSHEKGNLGISYLKRLWAFVQLDKRYGNIDKSLLNHEYPAAVFDALGIGLEPAFRFLYTESPTFEKFEDWIVTHGLPSADLIKMFNDAISQNQKQTWTEPYRNKILGDDQLRNWDKNGYIVIKQAIPRKDCEATVKDIYKFIEADPDEPASWYKDHWSKQGIMIQMFRNPWLHRNRLSSKIRNAYGQLWDRKDLFVSTDRVSFNPPEHAMYRFPGPRLHWDISLIPPIHFGLQGLLYLTDTPKNRGAFTLVPGFHKKIDKWLKALPNKIDPQQQDLYGLGPIPIAGKAGDFIIWHHALPHGSSPNRSTKPRIVQYINYRPLY